MEFFRKLKRSTTVNIMNIILVEQNGEIHLNFSTLVTEVSHIYASSWCLFVCLMLYHSYTQKPASFPNIWQHTKMVLCGATLSLSHRLNQNSSTPIVLPLCHPVQTSVWPPEPHIVNSYWGTQWRFFLFFIFYLFIF